MDAILQVENLTKQYPDFTLDHVSFSVPKGTIMGLIGENGGEKAQQSMQSLTLSIKMMVQLLFGDRSYLHRSNLKRTLVLYLMVLIFMKHLPPQKLGKFQVQHINSGISIYIKSI